LNAIGFKWNPGASTTAATRDDSFFTRVDELRAYKEEHGHLNVHRKDDEGLYDFCNTLRQARLGKGNYRLDDGQIAALDAIGFDYWNMGVPIDQVDKLYKVANVDKQKFPTELSVQPPSTEAGVSSRGRTRKMSRAMAESVSQQALTSKSAQQATNPKIDIGDVGYQFLKEFDSGWFSGTVVEILPHADDGWDRRCVYEDGDCEDLTLNELKRLATLSPQEHVNV